MMPATPSEKRKMSMPEKALVSGVVPARAKSLAMTTWVTTWVTTSHVK
jgi:hypothetical protein